VWGNRGWQSNAVPHWGLASRGYIIYVSYYREKAVLGTFKIEGESLRSLY
jgi:hypothetical protein